MGPDARATSQTAPAAAIAGAIPEVSRAVRAAAARLAVSRFLHLLTVTAAVAIAALFITLLVQRIFAVPIPWPWVLAGAGAAIVLVSLAWTLATSPRGVAAARILDERAELRESLSTAMCIAGRPDPWSMAMLETARSNASTLNVRRAVPIEPPRTWPVPLTAAVVLGLAWVMLPQWDVLKAKAKRDEVARQAQEVVSVRAEVAAKTKTLDELLAKAKVEIRDDQTSPTTNEQAAAPQTAEDIRRAAVKRLTDIADRLKQAADGDKAKQADALREAMRGLKSPGEGPLQEFQRQLARGNYDKAADELKDLTQQLNNKQLTPEQAANMKAQLSNLAKQLQSAAENKDALAQKFQAGGLDKKLAEKLASMASDPQALAQTLEQMQGLSAEQMQTLTKLAQAQMQASGQAQQMSQQMQQMAEGMQGQQLDQQGMQAQQGLGESLSAAEMASQEMAAMQAATAEASAQLAGMGRGMSNKGNADPNGQPTVGEWSEGEPEQLGMGTGGPGHGLGEGPEAIPTDYTVDKTKANVTTGKGPIIGTRLVYGDQVIGASRAEFSDAVETSSRAATEALESMQVPRAYHRAVKSYFGALEQKARKQAKPDAPAPTPPANTPPAKDPGPGN